MAIKIEFDVVDGQKHVPPDVMDLLIRLGHHKEFCDQCTHYVNKGLGDYCHIGSEIILKLADHPKVKFISEAEADAIKDDNG